MRHRIAHDDVRVIAASPVPEDCARATQMERLARVMVDAVPPGANPQRWLTRNLSRCHSSRVRVALMRHAQQAWKKSS